MLDEDGRETIERCADFACRTLHLLRSFGELDGVPREAFDALRHELQSWIGSRLEELGRYHEAAAAFGEAVISASSDKDRVASTAQMASSMAKAGNLQDALDLMLLREDELEGVKDPEIHDLWVAVKGDLLWRLGGRSRRTPAGSEKEFFNQAQMLMEQFRSGEGKSVSARQLLPFRDLMQRALKETPGAEPRHRLLLGLALLSVGDQDWDQAREHLGSAAALEDQIFGDSPKIERLALWARLQFQQRDLKGAVEGYRRARGLNLEALEKPRRLAVVGDYLHALGACNREDDLDEILRLVDELTDLLRQCLWRQPLASARRRIRELAQRPLSSALLALWGIYLREEGRGAAGQLALAKAWRVVMAARNPELQCPLEKSGCGERGSANLELESIFHRTLRKVQVEGEAGDWRPPLEELLEQEYARLRDKRRPPAFESSPPDHCPAVAFFQIGDLLTERVLLVLAHDEGRYHGGLLRDLDSSPLKALESWGRTFHPDGRALDPAMNPGGASALCRHVRYVPERPYQKAPPPPPLQHLLLGELTLSKPRCVFFPDGDLVALPLEMLPWAEGSKLPLGSELAVHMSLRPVPPPAVWENLSLENGWLGVGDVPAAGLLHYLEGTKREIEGLQAFFERQSLPAWTLLNQAATERNLRISLKEKQPEILHLACHGIDNQEFADACALVLADSPALPQRELLTYRGILTLPLSSVALVVLSACSSLIGPSGWSAGIQGLAWAFLEAGVPQVLASRYPVDDASTVTLMESFYRHLPGHSAADALSCARQECLGQLGLSRQDVGAWSIWC